MFRMFFIADANKQSQVSVIIIIIIILYKVKMFPAKPHDSVDINICIHFHISCSNTSKMHF